MTKPTYTFTVGMDGRRRDFDHSEASMYFKQVQKDPLSAPLRPDPPISNRKTTKSPNTSRSTVKDINDSPATSSSKVFTFGTKNKLKL